MSERKRLYEEPKCLLRSRAMRNPVVYAHLTEYRLGHCTLEEALAHAVVALDEDNARLAELIPPTPVVATVIVEAQSRPMTPWAVLT